MALENPTYLDELNESNPSGDLDDIEQGDDHIRAIKRAAKNTFPGLAGRAWRRITRVASGPLGRTDNMTVQNAAQGITLTADNANVLGNGWVAGIRAPLNASVSIAADEKINGSDADYVVPAGHMAWLFSDGTEFYAFIMYSSTPAQTPSFPAGTKMVFHQTVAPTGWTKLTNSQYNDAALRMTTGTVATGGADNFTATFGAGKSTAGHTLTIGQMPSHNHPLSHPMTPGSFEGGGGSADDYNNSGSSVSIGNTGGGGSHAHDLNNMNIKYVDIIVAEKT